jgi:hypothetical protein
MKRLAFLLVCLVALPLRADVITDLAAFDENGDGLFDQAELQRYFLAHDPDIEKQRKDGASEATLAQAALDRADDALTFLPCGGQACVAITLDTVLEFAQEHLRVSVKATDPKFGWKGLGFERSVTDTPNPRQTKTAQPAIFSYRRDENATDRDSVNIFGGARLYKNTWAIDAKASTPRNFFTLSTGIDFDLDGTKKAHENTIDVGVPLAYEWVAPGDSNGLFTGHVLTLTPKFGTDRAFDREIYGVDLLWSFTSLRFLRAGYLTRFPRTALRPRATIAWTPTVQLEFGDVADPAGNTDLEARKGTFLRVAPRVDITFRPIALHERVSLGIKYFHRFDLREDWQRPYGEATLGYDLTPTGSVAFTVAFRRGRKPPDFKDIDTTLIGIGIKK